MFALVGEQVGCVQSTVRGGETGARSVVVFVVYCGVYLFRWSNT